MQQKFSIKNNSLLSNETALDIAHSMHLPDHYCITLEEGFFDDITSIMVYDEGNYFVGCISLHGHRDVNADNSLKICGYNVCLCFRQVIDKHQQLCEMEKKIREAL